MVTKVLRRIIDYVEGERYTGTATLRRRTVINPAHAMIVIRQRTVGARRRAHRHAGAFELRADLRGVFETCASGLSPNTAS